MSLVKIVRSIRRSADEGDTARDLRDAAMALWTNVIRTSACASRATREQAERETDRALGRVQDAIRRYDTLHNNQEAPFGRTDDEEKR